jgi:hypothetical protein
MRKPGISGSDTHHDAARDASAYGRNLQIHRIDFPRHLHHR